MNEIPVRLCEDGEYRSICPYKVGDVTPRAASAGFFVITLILIIITSVLCCVALLIDTRTPASAQQLKVDKDKAKESQGPRFRPRGPSRRHFRKGSGKYAPGDAEYNREEAWAEADRHRHPRGSDDLLNKTFKMVGDTAKKVVTTLKKFGSGSSMGDETSSIGSNNPLRFIRLGGTSSKVHPAHDEKSGVKPKDKPSSEPEKEPIASGKASRGGK